MSSSPDKAVEPPIPGFHAPELAPSWRERVRARLVRIRTKGREVAANPYLWVGVGSLLVLATLSFTYFWMKTSRFIDERLAGEGAEVRAGIYAAPLVLRSGQPLAREDLIAYLRQLGYGSGNDGQTEGLVGRYLVEGDVLSIEPLDPAIVASGQYAAVEVSFTGERGIARIADARTKDEVKECTVEPLVIASAYNQREKRSVVEYSAIPDLLRRAIITTEDRRFWAHHGVDYRGIARAVRENWGESGVEQGGSTITQQVVKNVFLTPERTYTRKVKEAWMSFVLEWKLTKEQIFALYCNEVYLGQRGRYAIHGFAEAAKQYFGKDLSALSIDESALLAGIINAPSSNSPYRHADRAKSRRDLVLGMMVETKAITAGEAEAAKAIPLVVQPLGSDAAWLDAPYFSDYVQTYLEEVFGDTRSATDHHIVATTIDINLQRAAAEAVAIQLEKLDAVFAKGKRAIPPGTVQAALVAVEPQTGAVVAMVGGRNYAASQFNHVTDAARQPGSVFKPLVYATALTGRQFTPATLLMDAPQTFTYAGGQTYEPENYGESYANKEIPLRVAFRNSKNVPTVALALRTGLGAIADTAERAGLPRPEQYPSTALGVSEATPLEIAQAFTAFANAGDAVEPTPIAATSGDIPVPRPQARKVFSPQVAYLMTNMMEDVIARGTGTGVRARGVKGAVAGKTGTSRDGWFVGYTPKLVCVVWVGFDDNAQLGLTGAEAALPIWADFMKQVGAFRPDLTGNSFARPAGIANAKVCDESGARADVYCLEIHDEVFVAGTEPANVCALHVAETEIAPLYDEYGNLIDPPAPSITLGEPSDTISPEEESIQLAPGGITLPPAEPVPASEDVDASNRRTPSQNGRIQGTAGGARKPARVPPPPANRPGPKSGTIRLPPSGPDVPPQ